MMDRDVTREFDFYFFFCVLRLIIKKGFCCAKTQIRLGLTNDETRLGLGSIVFTYFFLIIVIRHICLFLRFKSVFEKI